MAVTLKPVSWLVCSANIARSNIGNQVTGGSLAVTLVEASRWSFPDAFAGGCAEALAGARGSLLQRCPGMTQRKDRALI